ncbi:hypothetical protein OC842_007253 [Tilletia horrida]|uniref:Uncharacterized protein n=1 Tax=Tilletia horrida TaxID=155126 RepID=A0AAN6G5T6_9BASI|nr:hypothetical protein OC842_007253 [Tilletia horrida]
MASLATAYDRGDISEMATPATIHLDANGLARAPISIGIMSGYGANRQPVQTMPAWKLLARYFQLTPDVRATKTLGDIFSPPVEGTDRLFPPEPHATCTDVRICHKDALAMLPSYCNYFNISQQNKEVQEMVVNIERGLGPLMRAPSVPNPQYLHNRHQQLTELLSTSSSLPSPRVVGLLKELILAHTT